jgi:hypothetical protein
MLYTFKTLGGGKSSHCSQTTRTTTYFDFYYLTAMKQNFGLQIYGKNVLVHGIALFEKWIHNITP